MPHRQNHRGAHPEDHRLFRPEALETLRAAVDDAAYLLERGYSEASVVDVVGRRYQLEARQRLALARSMCSDTARRTRNQRLVPVDTVRDAVLSVDGFNLIIGLEVALSGGPLLRGRDGAFRDLAGLRGSYHPVAETDGALDLFGRLLSESAPREVEVLLDAPVSNSGRLRAKILECSAQWSRAVRVQLVRDPDAELEGRPLVVSSDSLVLDRCVSWVNVLGHVLNGLAPDVWIVDLGP